MKRFINPKTIPLLVLGSSLLAMLLRIWTRGGGPDADGLFAPKPLVWCLLWLLTFATAAAIVMAVGRLKNSPVSRENYEELVSRMGEYIAEFEANGTDNLVIER